VYGLLGATLEIARQEDRVSVSVPLVEATVGPLIDTIAFSFDAAAVGLRREFLPGALAGVGDAAPLMPAVHVRVTEAAETEVGSSSAMFRSLARSICRIAASQYIPTDEELKALVRLTS
jgi:hypothetical protein